jgi:type II secretory pathway pseudopilin PulG
MPWHVIRRLRSHAGFTLVDVIVALGLLGILGAVAIPPLAAGMSEARARASARYLAARLQQARALAVTRSRAVALRVMLDGDTVSMGLFEDGNANGIRSSEIASGEDPRIGMEVSLGELFGAVRATESDGATSINSVRAALISFTPAGTASSTTVFLRGAQDGRFAVRVLGATGRIRVLRLDPSTGDWIDL